MDHAKETPLVDHGARSLIVFEQVPETTHFFVIRSPNLIEKAQKFCGKFYGAVEEDEDNPFWTEENTSDFMAFQQELFEEVGEMAAPLTGPFWLVFHTGVIL